MVVRFLGSPLTKQFRAMLFVGMAAGMLAAPVHADVKDWQKKIVKKIVKSHIYPRAAIAREIEGRARVRVTIDRSGKILTFDVTEPTGKSQLDKVIPKMMKKMDPLPAPPDDVPDSNLTFTIPISWRLQ